MASPILSTVVLNWNRAYLLRQTLESYITTVTCPQELWIVDNASSDDSRAVIEAFVAEHPGTHAIFLPENRGGEGYNEALPQLSGKFIYLCENDQVHLPGWCEHMLRAFETYPKLGQLSLHGPVPTDAEAWVSKQVALRFKNGCLLYQLQANVTTSSVIRGDLFRRGLALHNIPRPGTPVKFPDDARLSHDIKAMGFWVAYSDHYYVRNIGHEAGEMEQHPDYYRQNYAAKPAVGVTGMNKRVSLQKQLSAVQRASPLFPDAHLSGEISPAAAGQVNPRFWSMLDGRTPEVECIELIHALARAAKPSSVLETGGWLGHVSLAVARALKANGFGRLTVLESDTGVYPYLSARVAESGLDNIDTRREKSERFAIDQRYDFVIFDAAAEDPEEEFFHIMPALYDRATLVFLNVRSDTPRLKNLPARLEAMGILKGQHLPTPRGIYAGTFMQRPAEEGPKRVIFCLSAGRSGTAYLNSLIGGVPGLIALHEPEPKYQWQTLQLQEKPQHAREFVHNRKLPWTRQLPAPVYFEASHYVQKGFLEAWVEGGVIPDAIVLQRNPRNVALSWYALGADFHGDRKFVLQHMVHPDDTRPLFLPLPSWQSLNDYQLCYWYALECQQRVDHYVRYLSGMGGSVFETSLEALTGGRDLPGLFAWLKADLDPAAQKIISGRARQKVNHKHRHKHPARMESAKTLDLEALEADVRARCARSG